MQAQEPERSLRVGAEQSGMETAHRLRGRTLCVALGGTIPLTLFVQWSDLLVGGTMAAGAFPPLAACLLWALLLGVNRLAARGRRLFTRNELLVILSVWLAANMVAGRGLVHPLLTSLAGPTYYARSHIITDALTRYVPDGLALTDKAAARAFFEGHGVAVPWRLWARPLLTWTLFFVPFLTANLCLCALFERVWVRHERLAFPLVALPLEAVGKEDTRGNGRVDRRSFYAGMAFPLLLHGFGAAHAYLPGVPCVPFYNEVSSLLTDPPWTAAQPLYVNLYPILIGLTFLAPVDVTFGIWFFLLLNKAEMVVSAMLGWNDSATVGKGTSSFPYIEEQSAGAYLALGALLFWSARQHLRQVAAAMNPFLPAAPEFAALRPFAWGFVLGLVGTLAWCIAVGLPLWFAGAFFGFTLLVALVLSRLMAEGGVSWTLAPILPDKLILSLTGSAALAPLAITRLMFQVQHLRDTRQMLAPAIFSAGKLRDEAGLPLRTFYFLLLAGVGIAIITGVASALPLFYGHGALALAPNSDGLQMTAINIPTLAVGQASNRLLLPVKSSPGVLTALTFGAALTGLLALLRVRFLWWPLHPLGYALTGTLQLGYANKMFCSIFLGWALKLLTLRFGGARGFRLLRGAALGLICGDLLMGGILKLLDALLGSSGYALF